ncbi:NAD(P)/FAD-dependent oxidoreductase [Mycobacterium aquaticum]|uniref:Pyridine nucleotide-disulfide oxidoreductase n=1 Tax=Mycobacterium aquaticum TaxID=1927124 RepID=A0A1X0B4K1_9MYCO|nr:FAD-dependent oxidoreductase [Mycobacterium aquaticum]ORA37247.1 pyridine nucleotide-disulfide oxidoreductase [Mycobacterium aquaticum]
MSASGGLDVIQVFGRPNSPDGYDIRDFLGRSVVEFTWTDLISDDDARARAGVMGLDDPRLPVCVLPDGLRIESATVRNIAGHLGWLTAPSATTYDVSIYGAGPAGLSAAVYAASEGLSTVLLERQAVGGQAGTSSLIENYLGFPGGISGAHLAERARQQAVAFGAEILLLQEGVKATFRDGGIVVDLAGGGTMAARTNICATGVEYNRLNLAGEDRLAGAGLYYGAGAAEAPLCSGEDVYVLGGGNSAGQAALHMAAYARTVTVMMRAARPAASMSAYLLDRLTATPNVVIRVRSTVTKLEGDEYLTGFRVRTENDDEVGIETTRLFVLIGGRPNTEWANDTGIIRDANDYLLTGPDLLVNGRPPAHWPLDRQPYHLETSVPGSFAVGDVRHGSIKRVASAVGEGAMAVSLVHRYLEETGQSDD